MEGKRRKQEWVKELAELSSKETRDGMLVRVRCVEISGPGDLRYEVLVEARGYAAIADVPGKEGPVLAARIDELIGAFVDSVKLRTGGMIHA